jgi:hypothetical protein
VAPVDSPGANNNAHVAADARRVALYIIPPHFIFPLRIITTKDTQFLMHRREARWDGKGSFDNATTMRNIVSGMMNAFLKTPVPKIGRRNRSWRFIAIAGWVSPHP